MYFSNARRARQYVEVTEIQERYLYGPRLEAQLTGRGWLSPEHGVEALLRFLRTHCANLALPDMDSHLWAFFYKLKKKEVCTNDKLEYTIQKRIHPGLTNLWQDCNVLSQRKNQNCNGLISHHREVRYGIGPNITKKKSRNGTDALRAHGTKHRQRTLRIMTKFHLFFLSRCLPSFFFYKRVAGRQEREKHDTGCNRE